MASFTKEPKLGQRYSLALQKAFEWHEYQIRKQGEIPYLSHLMSVSALVLEAGGTEDEAIAALLHDAIEDVEINFKLIQFHFGRDVASIVNEVTDKGDYVAQIQSGRASAKLVSAADKLHNIRCYSTTGRHLWNDRSADLYDRLLPIYKECDRIPQYWIDEMAALFNDLQGGLACDREWEHEFS